MQKLFSILLLLLLPFLVQASGQASVQPFYIVDGQMGVRWEDIPSPEDIGRTTVLDSAEAVSIYGRRAAGGAVVITTKEYMKTHYKEPIRGRVVEDYAQDESLPSAPLRRTRYKGWLLGVGICLVGLLGAVLSETLPRLISKQRKRMVADGRIKERPYSPGPFDPEGVRFNATSHPLFYVVIALISLATAALGWMVLKMLTAAGSMDGVLIFACVLIAIMFIGSLLWLFTMPLFRKCYLVIDEKGIRGAYRDVESFSILPKFIEVDICWEQIVSAEIVCTIVGRNEVDGLAVFDKKSADAPTEIIALSFFSTRTVVDCVNYFYARHKGQSTEKPLVQPPGIEDNRVLKWGLMIIWIIALCAFLFLSGILN